jgi:hypothetical protein
MKVIMLMLLFCLALLGAGVFWPKSDRLEESRSLEILAQITKQGQEKEAWENISWLLSLEQLEALVQRMEDNREE